MLNQWKIHPHKSLSIAQFPCLVIIEEGPLRHVCPLYHLHQSLHISVQVRANLDDHQSRFHFFRLHKLNELRL